MDDQYFNKFLNDLTSFDKLRENLDDASKNGHNPRIRSFATTLLKELEMYKEICESLKTKFEK